MSDLGLVSYPVAPNVGNFPTWIEADGDEPVHQLSVSPFCQINKDAF
jgi:hypothetical protein